MAFSAGVTPKSLTQQWQFGVVIDGFQAGLFTKSDLPEVEFDEVAFAPAGSLFDQKVPGRMKFSDITLEKGIPQDTFDSSLFDWVKKVVAISASNGATGGVPAMYLKNIDLIRYDRAGEEVVRFKLIGAWVKTAKFGDGDGSQSDNMIESMTLSFQYFDVEKRK